MPETYPHRHYIAAVAQALQQAGYRAGTWAADTNENHEAFIEVDLHSSVVEAVFGDGDLAVQLAWTETLGWTIETGRLVGDADRIRGLHVGVVPHPAVVVHAFTRQLRLPEADHVDSLLQAYDPALAKGREWLVVARADAHRGGTAAIAHPFGHFHEEELSAIVGALLAVYDLTDVIDELDGGLARLIAGWALQRDWHGHDAARFADDPEIATAYRELCTKTAVYQRVIDEATALRGVVRAPVEAMAEAAAAADGVRLNGWAALVGGWAEGRAADA